MNNIKILLIVPLLLTCAIHGMDTPQGEPHLGAVFDEAQLAKAIATAMVATGVKLTGTEIKITGTSTVTSYTFPEKVCVSVDPFYGYTKEEMVKKNHPTQWKHEYTISFADKPAERKDISVASAPASRKAAFAYKKLDSDESPGPKVTKEKTKKKNKTLDLPPKKASAAIRYSAYSEERTK